MFGDSDIRFGGLGNRELRQRAVFPFDNEIHFADMDAFAETAVNLRESFVDFKNDDVRLVENSFGHAGGAGKIEIAVLIHRRHAHHGHIDVEEMAVVRHDIAEDHRDVIAQSPVAQLSFIGRNVPGVVEEMFSGRIAFGSSYRAEGKIAADLHIEEFVSSF